MCLLLPNKYMFTSYHHYYSLFLYSSPKANFLWFNHVLALCSFETDQKNCVNFQFPNRQFVKEIVISCYKKYGTKENIMQLSLCRYETRYLNCIRKEIFQALLLHLVRVRSVGGQKMTFKLKMFHVRLEFVSWHNFFLIILIYRNL